MTYPCTNCGTTEPGHRIGHACLCPKCDAIKSAKSADHFNRAAEARALARAAEKSQSMADHPAGKGPRYRASRMWVQCSCRSPMSSECKVHGAQL